MTRWRNDQDGLRADAGDCGGERQVSDAYSVRYVADPVTVTGTAACRLPATYREGEPLYPVVTVYWYVVELDRHAAADLGVDPRPGSYVVEQQTEYLLCTDPTWPGDTERWASDSYHTYRCAFDSVDAATAEAKHLAEAHGPGDVDWNGQELMP